MHSNNLILVDNHLFRHNIVDIMVKEIVDVTKVVLVGNVDIHLNRILELFQPLHVIIRNVFE